jgi:N-acetylneuraminic acid mutarotase
VNAGQNACSKDNKLLFCRTGEKDRARFDVYDLTSNRWFIGMLPKEIPEGASILSVNNTVYIAGGRVNGMASNQVWKLDF